MLEIFDFFLNLLHPYYTFLYEVNAFVFANLSTFWLIASFLIAYICAYDIIAAKDCDAGDGLAVFLFGTILLPPFMYLILGGLLMFIPLLLISMAVLMVPFALAGLTHLVFNTLKKRKAQKNHKKL